MNDSFDRFTYPCAFLRETEKALLVADLETGEELWLPLSELDEIHGRVDKGNGRMAGEGSVVLPLWLAREKGLK